MPRFHYQVLNAQGVSLEGMLRADSERDAARQLERRGLSVVEIRSGESGGRVQRGRLRHADVILSLQELATMLTSGVSIADAVGSQALGAHHPRIVAAYASMSRDLQREAVAVIVVTAELPNELLGAAELLVIHTRRISHCRTSSYSPCAVHRPPEERWHHRFSRSFRSSSLSAGRGHFSKAQRQGILSAPFSWR